MKPALPLALAALAALTACKKDAPPAAGGPPPITSATTDPLWSFAPADVEVAVVVADGVLGPLHAGALRGLADLEKAPGGPVVATGARKQVAGLPVNVLDPAAVATAGIDLAKGAAVFTSGSRTLAVLPVADPKKLVAALGGTSEGGVDRIGPMFCKELRGRYVCADSAANLEVAAAAPAASPPSVARELRGHAELFVAPAVLGGDEQLEAPGGLRVAATIERGAVTVRGHMIGKPSGLLAPVRGARSPLADGLAEKQPVGLVVIGAARVWDHFRAELMADAPPTWLPGGVTIAELAASIRGDLVGHALPGAPPRGMVRIGLSSEDAMKKLVGACGELAAALPAGLTLASKDGRCTLTADLATLGVPVPGLPKQSVEAWVEAGALVVGMGDRAPGSDARPGLDRFAADVLSGDWLVATWGRGALSFTPMLAAARATDPTGGMLLWAASHLNELGLAVSIADDGFHGALRVRTLWANPDAVVAAVQAAVVPASGDPTAALRKIAAEHPGSPFARDVEADQAGLTIQLAVIGAASAVAIPSFMKYIKRSKSTEARSSLQKLAAGARQHAVEHPGDSPLPRPGAGPTPPLGECCRQGLKCAPDPRQWEGEPWRSLHFSVEDAHHFSYEYQVEGDRFTVIARGDLDCDGVYSTFTLRGAADGALSEIEVVDEME